MGLCFGGAGCTSSLTQKTLLGKRESLCAAGPSLARRELVRNITAGWGSDEAATCRGQRGQVALPRLPLPPTPPPVVCAGLWLQARELGALSRFFPYPGWRPFQRRFNKSDSRACNVSAAQSQQADPAGPGTQDWVRSSRWPHPQSVQPASPNAPPAAWHPVGAFWSAAPKADFPLSKQPY